MRNRESRDQARGKQKQESTGAGGKHGAGGKRDKSNKGRGKQGQERKGWGRIRGNGTACNRTREGAVCITWFKINLS